MEGGLRVQVAIGAGLALFIWGARRRIRQRARPGHVDSVGSASGEPFTLQPRPLVLLLGDSITQQSLEPYGWGAALAAAYARERRADVVNRGFSGYNSRLLRRIVPALLTQLGSPLERVALVTLLIGSNDATRPGDVQHVSVDEYTTNVYAILGAVCARLPNARVLLLTPPAVDEATYREFCTKAEKGDGGGRHNDRLVPYVEAAKAAAAQHGATTIDLHAKCLATPSWQSRLLSDGLHLSGGGNKLVFELISEALCSELSDVSPGSLAYHMPRWNDVRAI
jgi:lysophospholipase L1-like esterase